MKKTALFLFLISSMQSFSADTIGCKILSPCKKYGPCKSYPGIDQRNSIKANQDCKKLLGDNAKVCLIALGCREWTGIPQVGPVAGPADK